MSFDIPPEAFHPQPPLTDYGYNAHSGGLPPRALPPGVILPGLPLMQPERTAAQGKVPTMASANSSLKRNARERNGTRLLWREILVINARKIHQP